MNEINLAVGTIGLSGLYVRPVQGTTLGSSIPLAEVSGAGGVYTGSMTGAAGYYGFLFYDATNHLIGTAGVSYWNGTQFIGLNAVPWNGAWDTEVADAISGLSTFDPLTDTVASVTTVGSVTDRTGYGLADGAITPAKIADGALTAAKFAAGVFDAVWAVATRTLTAISDPLGVTTLLNRLTSTRADNLDNLDATVGSRLSASAYIAPLTEAATQGAVGAALAAYDVFTVGNYVPPLTEAATQDAVEAALAIYGALTLPDLDTIESVAVGKFTTNFSTIPPIAVQYNRLGEPVATFELRQEDGTTPATSPQDAYQRVPI